MGGAAKRNLQNMALQFRRKREPEVTTQSSSPPPTPNKAKEAPKSPSQSDREDSKLMDYFEVQKNIFCLAITDDDVIYRLGNAKK